MDDSIFLIADTFRNHVMKRGPRANKAVFTIDDVSKSTYTLIVLDPSDSQNSDHSLGE